MLCFVLEFSFVGCGLYFVFRCTLRFLLSYFSCLFVGLIWFVFVFVDFVSLDFVGFVDAAGCWCFFYLVLEFLRCCGYLVFDDVCFDF